MSDLQNKPIIIGQPVEIEYAVNEIRKVLSSLSWIDRPYFIAQRFLRVNGSRRYYYPETYATEGVGNRNYQRLTPDGDFQGMFFFMVGSGSIDYQPNNSNFIDYPVGIIFYVNLDKIDSVELDSGLFTQRLLSEARQLLTNTMSLHGFSYSIDSETRDLREVYPEFVLDESEQYNRAPNQVFRLNLTIKIEEDCFNETFNYCESLKKGLTHEDHKCIINTIDFNDDDLIALMTQEQKDILILKLT